MDPSTKTVYDRGNPGWHLAWQLLIDAGHKPDDWMYMHSETRTLLSRIVVTEPDVPMLDMNEPLHAVFEHQRVELHAFKNIDTRQYLYFNGGVLVAIEKKVTAPASGSPLDVTPTEGR